MANNQWAGLVFFLRSSRSTRVLRLLVIPGFIVGIYQGSKHVREIIQNSGAPVSRWKFSKSTLQQHIRTTPLLANNELTQTLPELLPLRVEGQWQHIRLEYTVDSDLQSFIQQELAHYHPDYGAFVAIDPSDGKILAIVSTVHGDAEPISVATTASFPAASVFKLVTAAAAIEHAGVEPDTEIAFAGGNHTLYKRNVLNEPRAGSARHFTLREAFGRSINTVFGKLGVFRIGPVTLREYSERFGFNQILPTDFFVEPSRAPIPEEQFALAEAASGFTRDITLSPVHGALLAAAIANDGNMMEPYLLKTAYDENGEAIYQAEPRSIRQVLSPDHAGKIRELMAETVESGTSRKSFRGFGKKEDPEIGGKTGSLTGFEPFGKYDWFIGYMNYRGKSVAVAALTIHRKHWTVKSSYLGRRLFERVMQRER